MSARLLVITGTGTEIGKTHLSVALLLALRAAGRRVTGLKPVESGVGPSETDAARLAQASSFRVKPFEIALKAAVSPHRAAREEGVTIAVEPLAAAVERARADADVVAVELPGGLFTPLAAQVLNADFALRLAPDFLLLVAPDRLGTLHDVIAATRAAHACGLTLHGVALITPAQGDASTGGNATDLAEYLTIPVLATVPRAPTEVLARHAAIADLLRALPR